MSKRNGTPMSHPEANQKILLVDNEPDILTFISYNLKKEGYRIETATNGLEAIEIARHFRPDLILLDVMMPEMDGIETCAELRELDGFNSIIAFLTARNEDYSQIAGFDAGADDYISKPIKPRLLSSRIKALLRRAGNAPAEVGTPSESGVSIDREKYIVIKDGQPLSFPKKEFELLSLLMSKPGKVFTRETIMDNVWGHDVVVGDRTIDVHIRKLRIGVGEHFIKTVKGVGYRFDPDAE